METPRISIDASAICWRLAWIAVAFASLSMAIQSYLVLSHHEHVAGQIFFNVDKEHNAPALFSTLLLFSASQLLVLVAILERRQRSPDVTKWIVLAIGFLAMTVDEALSIHERVIEPVRHLIGAVGPERHLGVFFFTWVIPGIALVVCLGLYFARFLLRLPRTTARMLVLAALIYLGGALGFELPEGWWWEAHGPMNLTYNAMVSMEEGMEMIGVIVLIRALLGYISDQYGGVTISLTSHGHKGADAGAIAPPYGTARFPRSGAVSAGRTPIRGS